MTQILESLVAQSKALASGSVTSLSLAQRSINLAKVHSHLNAIVSLDVECVLSQARASNLRRKEGKPLSPIDGIPLAIKDNYLTKDYPTTACSNAKPLEHGNIDATVVSNLRAAGALIFAKTNMHEWAYGATNTTSTIGPTLNPHNHDHITGGSSGGSAAAVASGMVAAALGSDTGGSVRIPSSACGIYGFKPSYGRASRYGVLPLSWSLDAPGPLATTLEDIEMLLPYFLGRDNNDATTINAAPYSGIPEVNNLNLVNLTGCGLERSNEVDAVIRKTLVASSASVIDAEITNVSNYFASWEAILHSEASSYHANLLNQNAEGFSPVTRAHLEAGARLSAIDIMQAQKLRSRFMQCLLNDYGNWDALVLPTLPVPAPRHGDDWQEFGGRKVTTQDSMTWFCWLGNLAGLPCITLPVGNSDSGLPIGMMLMGRPNQDEKLLSVAVEIERSMK